jgi:hypothetical protein
LKADCPAAARKKPASVAACCFQKIQQSQSGDRKSEFIGKRGKLKTPADKAIACSVCIKPVKKIVHPGSLEVQPDCYRVEARAKQVTVWYLACTFFSDCACRRGNSTYCLLAATTSYRSD